jgi:hypothetical protein
MPQAQWQAGSDGRYWIGLDLAGRDARVVIDLGLTDVANRVGFEIDPVLYDSLDRAGALSHCVRRVKRDASGQRSVYDTGLLTARLIEPLTRQRIGSQISAFAGRGVAGLPNYVGVVFFHRLAGCRGAWEFDQRTWTIDCP